MQKIAFLILFFLNSNKWVFPALLLTDVERSYLSTMLDQIQPTYFLLFTLRIYNGKLFLPQTSLLFKRVRIIDALTLFGIVTWQIVAKTLAQEKFWTNYGCLLYIYIYVLAKISGWSSPWMDYIYWCQRKSILKKSTKLWGVALKESRAVFILLASKKM